jgi:hypothetical protein
MVAEWSVACGADDPVLVVPWAAGPEEIVSSDLGPQFVDLRENPYDLDLIPEAEQHPSLMHALRALNAARSPVFTAKCDAWKMDDDEREEMLFVLAPNQLDLDDAPQNQPGRSELDAEHLLHGFSSYIDLIWRERAVFVSFHQQEQLLHRLARQAAALYLPHAALDCTLRPALVDLAGPQEGFAVTLYVKALGADEGDAYRNWAEALAAAVGLVRSRDLSLSKPSIRRLQLPQRAARPLNGGE